VFPFISFTFCAHYVTCRILFSKRPPTYCCAIPWTTLFNLLIVNCAVLLLYLPLTPILHRFLGCSDPFSIFPLRPTLDLRFMLHSPLLSTLCSILACSVPLHVFVFYSYLCLASFVRCVFFQLMFVFPHTVGFMCPFSSLPFACGVLSHSLL
jgi:hypothetical protein